VSRRWYNVNDDEAQEPAVAQCDVTGDGTNLAAISSLSIATNRVNVRRTT